MSSKDIAISVRGVSKSYNIIHQTDPSVAARQSLRHRLGRPFQRTQKETFWALTDVSADIQQGDVVGIIGRNGAGKSTLLKIISRITAPTTGEINVYGRIGSLLEVGTGFHPELTGRENIHLNGGILGMRRADIQRSFDEIVDFAGVEQFLDTPVKRYSSGMYVRLAFAVAAHLNSDILVVDEVLAVGDMQFRRKCLNKMHDVSVGGRTVLFVSHDTTNIRQLCNQAIWLHNGRLLKSGIPRELCTEYEQQGIEQNSSLCNPSVRPPSAPGYETGPKVETVELRDLAGKLCNRFEFGQTFDLILTLDDQSPPTSKEYAAIWFLHNELGQQIAVGPSFPLDCVCFTNQDRTLKCRVGPLHLPVGFFYFRIVLYVTDSERFDDWNHAVHFEVTGCDPFNTGYNYPGPFEATHFLAHKWVAESRAA